MPCHPDPTAPSLKMGSTLAVKAPATDSKTTDPPRLRHTRTTQQWPCFQLAKVALFSVGVNTPGSFSVFRVAVVVTVTFVDAM